MDTHEVVIAGGGPTGLMLASELALAGVDVGIVERRTSQELVGSRAGGLHIRTMEELDQRGLVERFVDAGTKHPAAGFAHTPLDLSDQPSRHNCVLALWQQEIERTLADRVLGEQAVPIHRGCEVTGLRQDAGGVTVERSSGGPLRAPWLVGCDGGRSVVRKAAGIDFPGWEPTTSWMIAQARMADDPPLGFHKDGSGTHAIGPGDDGSVRIVLTEPALQRGETPTLDELRATLRAVYGSDFGVHSPTSISRFTDQARQAATYRDRRVLLAGDAAHIHPPQGGQGLNTGVQDAMNLGWKLAQVVHGTSRESLLDTYEAERHPVGAQVLQNTLAQVVLGLPDDRHDALRQLVVPLLGMDGPRSHLAAQITGLAIRYELGGDHPVVGRRMPDLELEGSTRVAEQLRDGRGLLLVLDGSGPVDLGAAAARVRPLHTRAVGPWVLPVVGPVDAPPAVLVRPDGYVAWTGRPTNPTLSQALERWFGPG